MRHAILSTVVLATVSTLGDFIWASWLPEHRAIAGIIHGALLCLAAGAMLGLPERRLGAGAVAGLVVGVLAAGTFYALSPLLGYGAMLPAWFVLWVLLSLSQVVVVRRERRFAAAIGRGALAGAAAGAAFYTVSGMWTSWDPATIDYAEHFLRWLVAFAPGFLALQVGIRSAPPRPPSRPPSVIAGSTPPATRP